jgi:purine-binding chemotaxis protein CheW
MSSPPNAEAVSTPQHDGVDRIDVLVCRVGGRFCALPLAHVVETMRPLLIEPLSAMPRFVSGLSIIRGLPVPVVDAGVLLGTTDCPAPTRFVTLAIEGRHVALAVEAVIGIRQLPAASLGELPPLLREASAEAIAAVGALDASLLVVLRAAHIVPDAVWNVLSADRGTV